MAAELSEVLGRKIVFQDLPSNEYCTSIEHRAGKTGRMGAGVAAWCRCVARV